MSVSEGNNTGGAASSQGAARLASLERDAAGRLVVRLEGQAEPVADATVARCFPWSIPDGYISIRDKKGREIVLLETLEGLDPASRALLEEELRDKIFKPSIRRIIRFQDEFGVTSIEAETDRGAVTFQIRSRDDVRVLGPARALFRDVDGNTYELTDLGKLDRAAQRHLQQYF
jgi:hypothetical protein